MKVLVIHNFHRTGSASGDDQVFKCETKLLEEHGVQVVRYSIKNDEFDNASLIEKIGKTIGMLWSIKHYKAVKKIIKIEKPDIVHVHTFFPLLSPSVLYAAKREGCKVVATLHDTRFICPCATSLRGAELCNACGDGRYLRMYRYRCFKGSKIQSLIVALIFKYHRLRKSFYYQIDKYICLNDNQIKLLTEIGFNSQKIMKKYNFSPDVNNKMILKTVENLPKRYVVFYGRIGEEKGIHILKEIWEKLEDIPLVVMGSGPQEDSFSKWAEIRNNVFYLGYTEHERCLSIVKAAEFVVFPSIWYEGCSMVVIESECLGKPLIATDLGFSVEAIQNGYNGYKVACGDVKGFAKAISELWNEPEKIIEMGKNARREYESKYMSENNYEQLMSIYGQLFEGEKNVYT